MLTARFIRENAARVRRDLARRHVDAPLEQLLQVDEQHRALLAEVESLRAERNAASKAIGQTKDPAERGRRIAAARELSDRLTDREARLRELENALQQLLYEIPNIIDDDVPDGADESANVVVETVGEPPTFDFQPLPHWDLGERLGGIDLERGAKMAGSRFFVLRGQVARLHRALTQWMLDLHVDEGGFTEHYLPYMMSEASFWASGHLPKFRENLYFDGEEDYFFIPTAEAPFANLYRDEILPAGSLPMRFVAHTPCFRREKMSAGRDTRGLKRVHQFEKVEMFIFCEAEQSDSELNLLVRRAKSIPERLGLAHRVVQLCSGDLDFKASKGFDVEIWSPGIGEWLEVSSCSNVRDFQAVRANIRYRPEEGSGTRYPHMLNGSGLAPGRTLIAVLENYQQRDGSVVIPDVLRCYMGGAERIEPPPA
ncbi:MAG: serine--tRNA ligase [Dehalococcoidia bacterium]